MKTALTIIITGGSDGIGGEAARQLSRSGDTVVIVGRSVEKTRAVANELNANYFVADFTNLTEVKTLATTLGSTYPHMRRFTPVSFGQAL